MNTWIFQGNPDRFDIDKYLSQSQKIYWTVTHRKHQNELALGDLIYLWRAKGSNNAISGIIAYGRVVEECKPRDQVNDPIDLYDNLWQENNIEASEIKAGILISKIRLTPKKGMLRSTDLHKDPLLSEM
jgi:predicted RNA-binding protein with PUA-like domain